MTSKPTPNRIFAVAVLTIICATAAIVSWPAQASPPAGLYINSSGQRIPTVFRGLRPDARFANTLNALKHTQTASLDRQASNPHFQTLAYREGCPKKALRNAALLQVSCLGQYMVAHYYNCTLGCGGHSYRTYSSTGTYPCSGYYIVGDACNGCEYQESSCDPCS